jgi:release factor glutamine methyltransferase
MPVRRAARSDPPVSTERLTVGEVVRRTAQYFVNAGSSSPRLDADLVIAHALGMTRLQLYMEFDRPLSTAELAAARELVARRGRREPLAYIVGRRAFRRLELDVSPSVLVPRPETEILVEWALEAAGPDAAVLDWGTGSGAIALALADERPDLVISASDASEPALAVARANAERLGLKVAWICSDGFSALAGATFDLVVTNPPYLSDAELEAAPAELGFEPRMALAGGPRGDEVIAGLASEVGAYLRPGGVLLCEVGETQAAAVAACFVAAGLVDPQFREDLAGITRVVSARRS